MEKRTRYTSPRGVFVYPKLTAPDTKFKAEGEYSVKLKVAEDAPGVAALVKQIEKEAAASLAAAKEKAKTPAEAKKWETKYLPFTRVEDDEGNATGEIEFKFSMKASGVSKKTGKPWTMKPTLFDAKGKPINGSVNIGNGTVGKVSYEIIPYSPTAQVGASVKLALAAAQIIELRSYGEQSAKDHGFDEEDGYEASDAPAQGDFEDESESEGGESEKDF